MTEKITIRDANGRVVLLGTGAVRLEIGSVLQLGAAVEAKIEDDSITLAGPDLMNPPAKVGSLYIDESGYLRVRLT